jgi:hypothetical protein
MTPNAVGPVYIPCGSGGGGQPANSPYVQNGEIAPVIPCIGSNGLVLYAPNPVEGDMFVENGGGGGCGGGCAGGAISVQQGLAASRAVSSGGAVLAAAAVLAVVASLVVIH